MASKIYIPEGESAVGSQIGASLDVLSGTIDSRRDADGKSYTYRLLNGELDMLLKKLAEEAGETMLAAKEADMLRVCSGDAGLYDQALDHLRYEAGDVLYHLLVLLNRFNISVDELAAEMNTRMAEDELSRHKGMARLDPGHVNRGK